VAEYVARLRNVSLETLAQETTQNACQLFGLALPEDLNEDLKVGKLNV
jgi:TatD DNase family protein